MQKTTENNHHLVQDASFHKPYAMKSTDKEREETITSILLI